MKSFPGFSFFKGLAASRYRLLSVCAAILLVAAFAWNDAGAANWVKTSSYTWQKPDGTKGSVDTYVDMDSALYDASADVVVVKSKTYGTTYDAYSCSDNIVWYTKPDFEGLSFEQCFEKFTNPSFDPATAKFKAAERYGDKSASFYVRNHVCRSKASFKAFRFNGSR